MLKALAGNHIILGLSGTNIARLKIGQPIKFNLKALGLEDREIYIFYGETEKDLKKMLEPLIGPNTKGFDTSVSQDN